MSMDMLYKPYKKQYYPVIKHTIPSYSSIWKQEESLVWGPTFVLEVGNSD